MSVGGWLTFWHVEVKQKKKKIAKDCAHSHEYIVTEEEFIFARDKVQIVTR
jgi:hypothetical protein